MTGDDVTFPEFIQYVVASGNSRNNDEHWRQQHLLSSPCHVNYTFIGKFETLHEDMAFLVSKLFGLNHMKHSEFMNRSKTTDQSVMTEYYKDIPNDHIEELRKLYFYDFLLFGYKMELKRKTEKSLESLYYPKFEGDPKTTQSP